VKLTLESEAVLGFNANRTRIRYTTEADAESSGAPCFDGTWNLVAVHHADRWDPGRQMFVREGVPIAAIRDRLRRLGRAASLGGDPSAAAARSGSAPPPEPGPVTHPDDPQKGRWGGLPERDGRRVSVELLDTSGRKFSFNVVAESTDGTALEGPVLFHLHDSYPNTVIQVREIRRQAKAVLEELRAFGVFTIGVQVKDKSGNWVGLEFDLAQIPNLPERFRER
jgi:hypothetical protein